MGLSRRSLDDALLRLAEQRGATILRGQAVRGLDSTSSGFIARTASAGPISADTVFLATGKHDLRDLGRPSRADGLLGLKMYYELEPDQRVALHGCIELLLFRGGYAGLQLVDHDRAVLCLLLPAERYRRAGLRWDCTAGRSRRGSTAVVAPPGRREAVPGSAPGHFRHALRPPAPLHP